MTKTLDYFLIIAGGGTVVLTNVWMLVQGSIVKDWVIPHTILNIVAGGAMATAYFLKGGR